MNKKKIILSITAILTGAASTISSSTLKLWNRSACILISSSTALLTSIAILITKEHISKLGYTNIPD